MDKPYDEIVGKLIFFNVGSSGRVSQFMDKENINALAIKYGLNVDKTFVVERQIPERFTAMVEPYDYRKRVKTHEIGILQWCKELLHCKCLYYMSVQDFGPVWRMLCDIVRRKLKK